MKRFTKRIEDFTCENCGYDAQGSGYTNHCPLCLWSKHVDINPGDRACKCQGMMRPVALQLNSGEKILTHCCIKCGAERRNKVSAGDNFESLLNLTMATQGVKISH